MVEKKVSLKDFQSSYWFKIMGLFYKFEPNFTFFCGSVFSFFLPWLSFYLHGWLDKAERREEKRRRAIARWGLGMSECFYGMTETY